jgi:hypothetical protein
MVICVLGALLYALWMPALRVQEVRASTERDASAAEVAQGSLGGTYAYILPRNSIFFVPKERMRAAVLDAYPEIAAVSITRSAFSAVTIATTPRAKAFIWCGTTIEMQYPSGCFDADAEGLIFKQSTIGAEGATTTPQGELRIFSALDAEVAEGETPIRRHVMSATSIPDALRFIKAVRGLGAPVSALALRGDEADLWLNGPTRITYVLGREEEAAELAASVLPKLPLANGSIQYVDLRFTGKVYVKRYGE